MEDLIHFRNSIKSITLINYRLLTTCPFIDFNRFPIQFTNFYRLLSNVIDYRFYRLHMPGGKENGHPRQQRQLPAVMTGRGKWDIINSLQHFLK